LFPSRVVVILLFCTTMRDFGLFVEGGKNGSDTVKIVKGQKMAFYYLYDHNVSLI